MPIVINEGSAASVMSLAYWKGLGSPMLSKSVNMLTRFDGRSFQPYGILPSLEVQLAGKTFEIKVEVIDVPLEYNILLGRNWMYNMQDVASSRFQVVCFRLNGKIVVVEFKVVDAPLDYNLLLGQN